VSAEQALEYFRAGERIVAALLLGYYLENRLKSVTASTLGRTYAVLSEGLQEMQQRNMITRYRYGLFGDLLGYGTRPFTSLLTLVENDFQTAIKKTGHSWRSSHHDGTSEIVVRRLPSSGPVISLLLIGLVLLNALLYYRSVKIQRFLEPALALSQPERVHQADQRAVPAGVRRPAISGLKVRRSSIQMQRSLIIQLNGKLQPKGKKSWASSRKSFLLS